MASVGTKALRAVFGAAASAGIDTTALARAHAIDPAALRDPDARFPHRVWSALWDEVTRRTGDAAIGLHAAEKLETGYWDLIDYVTASSDTVGDALARFSRWFALISTGAVHTLGVGPRDARIVRDYAPGVLPTRAATEFAFANIALRIRRMAAEEWSPASVDFTHAPAAPSADYARVFRCPVRFGRAIDVVTISKRSLSLPMSSPAPELCAVLERHAALLLGALPDDTDLAARTRHALAKELRGGSPSIGTIAKRLGLGARTLQRRLAERGTPFRALLETTREELARRYLEDPSIGVTEVAFLVGFSDASAFNKAFRRWTGKTPGAYRARL